MSLRHARRSPFGRQPGIGLIVVTSVFLFGFNFGLEPYVYLVADEMPARNLRAYTMGLSATTSFAFAWLAAFTTPYFINPSELNRGPKYGYIWFASGTIVCVFVYFMLPEVRGRTLEEIDEMFRMGVATKDFPTYVCVEVEEARERATMNVMALNKLADEDKPTGEQVEHAREIKA
ncbi:hypothetical protein B0T17DRAFT_613955 [Bombardia bombarda]|uniref:Major facilitator superfamily (MFS) profile domain-containing protein n=1 Tax=Bombardia bombarda TaxID=252184 RepID=A0AA40CGH1_9PEZI|nr:hypothetical protein B0T17DRAFT_613955 [Bombardia bombarda]